MRLLGMSDQHDHLLSSYEPLKARVEWLICHFNNGFAIAPQHILCAWKELLEQDVLRAYLHRDNPIVRRSAKFELGRTTEEQLIHSRLCIASGEELHVAVVRLARGPIHDDVDRRSKVWQDQLGIAAKEGRHLCPCEGIGNLFEVFCQHVLFR